MKKKQKNNNRNYRVKGLGSFFAFMGDNLANFSFSTPKRQKWRRLFSPLLVFLRQICYNGVEKRWRGYFETI